jgi:predicted nucleotidyltransferase
VTGASVLEALRAVLSDLASLRRPCAVVGGLAVSARTVPRFTRDVDLAISVESDADAESVVARLLDRGYRMLGQLEHADTGRLATVRLLVRSPSTGELHGDDESEAPVVDLLFAMSGVEQEVVAGAEPLSLASDVVAPVARRGHLIALKVLSAREPRPQDSLDLAALLDGATAADLELARTTLGTIRQRGFHRSKDLLAELEQALGRA